MKIGISLPAVGETCGGSFSFETDVARGLLSAFSRRDERPVLIGNGARALDDPAKAEWVSIDVNGSNGNHGSVRIREFAKKVPLVRSAWQIIREATSQQRHARFANAVSSKLESHGIEFLVHLNPYCIATFDIPFSTVVWDLEHRRQPYFPEVSAAGEWESRERLFGDSLRRATIVVTGTDVGREQIESFYHVARERILVLPLPTPRDSLQSADSPIPSRPEWLPDSENVLLYPAQFWPHKNHIGLIRMMDHLRNSAQTQYTLVCTGSDKGNQVHVEREIQRYGLADHVHLPGFVGRADLLAAYRHVRALVYPSFFGPDNLPPLEAFAVGCPVVAAAIPGAQEQLGEAAVLVDPKDHIDFANAVVRITEDDAYRNRLIESGKQRANAWTADDYANRLLDAVDSFAVLRSCWA